MFLLQRGIFYIISEFPNILSLKSFGNYYTMFLVLDFMHHFTCGESNCFIILFGLGFSVLLVNIRSINHIITNTIVSVSRLCT